MTIAETAQVAQVRVVEEQQTQDAAVRTAAHIQMFAAIMFAALVVKSVVVVAVAMPASAVTATAALLVTVVVVVAVAPQVTAVLMEYVLNQLMAPKLLRRLQKKQQD